MFILTAVAQFMRLIQELAEQFTNSTVLDAFLIGNVLVTENNKVKLSQLPTPHIVRGWCSSEYSNSLWTPVQWALHLFPWLT
jgi:hypothetical protein